MENGNEFSSPLSFTSSSCVSNGSSSPREAASNLELLSLSKLSSGLEKLLIDAEFDYSDAEIEVEGVCVGVNRCILAARSQFFHEKFKTGNDGSGKEGKPKFLMTELLPHGWVGYEAFKVFLNYLYTGKLKGSPPEVSTCVDESCVHCACFPAINYAVELMYASSTFQMKELKMLVQRRLFNFVEKAVVEDVIPILMVAYHCELSQLLEYCVQRVTRSDLDNFTLEKELPPDVFSDIKANRLKFQQNLEPDTVQVDSLKEKRIRRILRALDSDDVELVKLLLEESMVTLDDAYALHYAAAYCNPKLVSEVLQLGMADLNLPNARGYTALHIAARRKDPSIILGLLNNGASVADLAPNGQGPVAICRRLTRPKDYNVPLKQGIETNKDRLCIDVLEREMRGNPMVGNMSLSSSTVADELFMGLYFLENRETSNVIFIKTFLLANLRNLEQNIMVALARTLFPREAKLAMEQAHADSTSEFAGLSSTNGLCGNLRGVDLNELPSDQVKRLKERLLALQNTVRNGRRFFPNCSEVLDRLLEDDVLDSLMLESGTLEEQRTKKMRYIELKEEVKKAFVKDKAEHNWSSISPPSSSSTSAKNNATTKLTSRSQQPPYLSNNFSISCHVDGLCQLEESAAPRASSRRRHSASSLGRHSTTARRAWKRAASAMRRSRDKTVVWVANRARPVNSRGSNVKLKKNGALTLTDVDGAVVWESNTTSTRVFTKNNRLISVLREGGFDPGYFSLYFDGDNVLKLIYDGPEVSGLYWPNPDLDAYGNQRTIQNSTRIAFLDNSGKFFSSDRQVQILYLNASDAGDERIKRRMTLDVDGNLRIYSLQDSTGVWKVTWEALPRPCRIHGICGRNGLCYYAPEPRCSCPPGYVVVNPNDWSRGCKALFNVTSLVTQPVKFLEISQVDYWGFDLNFTKPFSFEDCKDLCLKDHNCMAFSYRRNGEASCYTKNTLYNGYRSPDFPGSIFLKLPRDFPVPESGHPVIFPRSNLVCSNSSEQLPLKYEVSSKKVRWVYLYSFCLAVGVIELLVCALGWLALFSKHGIPASLENGYCMLSSQFRMFTYAELKKATKNFKVELGRGGSGAVYKGVLADDRAVAVKKLGDEFHGEEQFWAEMTTIGKINHMNLGSRLSSWAAEESELHQEAVDLKQFLWEMKSKVELRDESWVEDIVDKRLEGKFSRRQAKTLIKVGVACVEEDRNMRPTMASVVQTLLECEDETTVIQTSDPLYI
nr:regulatory protein NPR3-like [Ipomoea batatas]